jgi:hypothetical protein
VAPSYLLAEESEAVLLARSDEEERYYVFRGERLLGEWIGESVDCFLGAQIVDEPTARRLVEGVRRKRGGENGLRKSNRRV